MYDSCLMSPVLQTSAPFRNPYTSVRVQILANEGARLSWSLQQGLRRLRCDGNVLPRRIKWFRQTRGRVRHWK